MKPTKQTQILCQHHLTVWHNLLLASQQKPDAALDLLASNARTTLFYLEAATRLLADIGGQKKMRQLNERFKLIEDALGEMDYVQGLLKTFRANKKIPAEVINSLDLRFQTAAFKTNALLMEQGWLGKKANRFAKAKKTFKKLDWLSDAAFKNKLHTYYQKQIGSIVESLAQPLTEIEAGVHELRRDVRWLSIYPQTFKGFVQLKPARLTAQKWVKYLTPEIVNSPFNQLTRADDVSEFILLNQNNFYAMSWLIAALGTLKDQGLSLLELTNEWREVKGANADEARQLALSALGVNQANEQELLAAVRQIVQQVKKDGVFDGLLVG